MRMMLLDQVKLPAPPHYLDKDKLDSLIEALKNPQTRKNIPAIHVAEDGRLLDGTHRYYAYALTGHFLIPVRVNDEPAQ